MKTYYFGLFIVLLALTGCNDPSDTECIYLDERLCDPTFDNSILMGMLPFDSDVLEGYDEKVFLEDFTGFRCTNCPRATGVANNLKEKYGDRLIIAAVHCSQEFAAPTTTDPNMPFYLDFRTESGEAYYVDQTYDILGLPSGVMNRLGNDFTNSMPDAFWPDRMAEWMSENAPEVYVEIFDVSFNMDSSAVAVDVKVKPLMPSSEERYFMNMAILESGIPEAQKTSQNETIYDYIHNHVLRGNSHGPWGVMGYPGSIMLPEDQALHYQFRMDLKPDWIRENCEIVIHVSKESNREVIQVEEVHMIE